MLRNKGMYNGVLLCFADSSNDLYLAQAFASSFQSNPDQFSDVNFQFSFVLPKRLKVHLAYVND